MRLLFIISILATSLTSFAQSGKYPSDFVFEANLPDQLSSVYHKNEIRNNYSTRKDLNPFYLTGDLDGDKKIDYALGIIEKKTGKKGILIYHAASGKYFIIGAGKVLGNGGDNFNWMDCWKLYDRKNGQALWVEKLEAASALIYWTGKEYRWEQQGD